MRTLILSVFMAVVFGGCTHGLSYSPLEPGSHTIGNSYRVVTSVAWSERISVFDAPKNRTWLNDRRGAGILNFWHDLVEGDAIWKSWNPEFPIIEHNMQPHEVAELYVEAFTRNEVQEAEFSNLRPANFGTAEGFRFDMSFRSRDGRLMRGVAIAALIEQKLHMISFFAPEADAYDEYRAEAERIMASVELL